MSFLKTIRTSSSEVFVFVLALVVYYVYALETGVEKVHVVFY